MPAPLDGSNFIPLQNHPGKHHVIKTAVSAPPTHTHTHTHSHLYGTDDGGKQTNHAQELHPAQALHGVLLTHVGDGVQGCADQNQAVAHQNVRSCRQKTHITLKSLQLYPPPLLVLTGSLISASQQVSPHHGPDSKETDADSDVVREPVASLQNPPGQQHQDWDHKAVQQLGWRRRR